MDESTKNKARPTPKRKWGLNPTPGNPMVHDGYIHGPSGDYDLALRIRDVLSTLYTHDSRGFPKIANIDHNLLAKELRVRTGDCFITKATVSALASNNPSFPVQKGMKALRAICQVFDLSADYVLGLTDNPEPKDRIKEKTKTIKEHPERMA